MWQTFGLCCTRRARRAPPSSRAIIPLRRSPAFIPVSAAVGQCRRWGTRHVGATRTRKNNNKRNQDQRSLPAGRHCCPAHPVTLYPRGHGGEGSWHAPGCRAHARAAWPPQPPYSPPPPLPLAPACQGREGGVRRPPPLPPVLPPPPPQPASGCRRPGQPAVAVAADAAGRRRGHCCGGRRLGRPGAAAARAHAMAPRTRTTPKPLRSVFAPLKTSRRPGEHDAA